MSLMKNTLALLLLLLWSAPGRASSWQTETIPYSSYLDGDKLIAVVSFDGSRDLKSWEAILAFARERQIPMTFFVSGVYFLSDDDKGLYPDPVDPRQSGVSLIGFGGNAATVEARKSLILAALRQGHDIESHLNGHFDATHWSQSTWEREFRSFYHLSAFLPAPPAHVRFPLLAMNDQVYPIMAEFGVKTITSVAANDFSRFNRITGEYRGAPYTFLELPIPRETDGKSRFILMDYNIYLNDQLHHRTPAEAEAAMVQLYLDEAAACFREHRPLFISHHFTEWNEGAYWNALKTAVVTLQKKYPVKFVTIAQLYAQLNAEPARVAGPVDKNHPTPGS